MKTVIAIDGPAASGKSSVARELARRHGLAYVNSGHMYRALTWLILRANAIPDNEESVMRVLDVTRIECGIRNGESYFILNGEDPSADLRRDEINRNVSAVSAHPSVRNLLLSRLRGLAEEHDLVMEGRDIGSAVFPNTPWKFYIDASVEVRRQRRAGQGEIDTIAERDRIDSSRAAAPLKIAPDAVVIDSSHLTLEQVVNIVETELKRRGFPSRSSAAA